MTVTDALRQLPPFLQRNWIAGYSDAMGAAVSAPGKVSNGVHDAEEDDHPAPKRRRLFSALNHKLHEPALLANAGSAEVLRVDITRLLHKKFKRVRIPMLAEPRQDAVRSTMNCRITILDTSHGSRKVLACHNQLGETETFKHPLDPRRMAKIKFPKSFKFSRDAFMVRKPQEHTFDFADSYEVIVEFEAPLGDNWPPLEKEELGLGACPAGVPVVFGPYSTMSTRVAHLHGKHWSPLFCENSQFLNGQNAAPIETDYVVELDFKWCGRLGDCDNFEDDAEPMVHATESDQDLLNSAAHGDLAENISMDPDDPYGVPLTPSRSLRTRGDSTNYNLKVLSDRAQGKNMRKRQPLQNGETPEGKIQYVLPTAYPVNLEHFRCIRCYAYHPSLKHLMAHLEYVHENYKFDLNAGGDVPRLQVSRLDLSSSSGRPTREPTPLDLEAASFIGGESRTASSHEHSASAERDHLDDAGSATSISKHSRHDEPGHAEPKQKPISVPNIKQPLFHPVSKAQLQAGQAVPGETQDSSWLIHKHIQGLYDFDDLEPAEVEFIRKWDEFILRESITSSAFIAQAWLKFVDQHASWLVIHQRRMIEFLKHASVLFVRELLDDEIVDKATRLINKARQLPKKKVEELDFTTELDATKVRPPKARQSASGCSVCRLPVFPPRLLVCANKECSARLYHSDCIKEKAEMRIDQPTWLCNSCHRKASA